jgi:hypothetical protein
VPLTPWDVALEIVDGDAVFNYKGEAVIRTSGTFTFQDNTANSGAGDGQSSTRLQEYLSRKPSGSALVARMRVRPHSDQPDDFRQVLTFPLRVADASGRPALPLEPHYLHFEDPEYNRRLASPSAHVAGVANLSSNNTPVQRAITLSADRRECNATSSIFVRYDWENEPGAPAPAASISVN